MLPFSRDKIISYYAEAQTIHRGLMPIPRMALIYPSYICGHNCVGCHYKGWNKQHKGDGFMDYGKYIKMVDDLHRYGVKSIEFCGGGEPTLHPQFYDMVFHVEQLGMKFGLFTNAEGIDDKNAELLARVASYVRVSIDEEAEWGNLERLIKARKEQEHKNRANIGVKILVSGRNEDTVEQKIRQAVDAKVDYIQIKPEKPTKNPIKDSGKIEKMMGAYRLLEGAEILGGVQNTQLEDKCWLSPIHTMIDAYGDVYICCYFQFRQNKHKIGNCFDKGFKRVWESQKHALAITEIDKKECDVFDCRWHKYNSHLKKFMEQGHIEFI